MKEVTELNPNEKVSQDMQETDFTSQRAKFVRMLFPRAECT